VKKTKKRSYRIRNWREYNAALVQRGSLTLWIDQAVLSGWLNQQRTGKRGASNTYTDAAIVAVLTLKVVYRLPLRATAGLLASLLKLIGLQLPVPHYSTLCRRQKTLQVALPRPVKDQALHVVVDATGCKVYGEGEWKVRQHGISKRRTWRKLHVAVDEATGEIAAAVLTTNDVADSIVLPHLLEQVEEPIQQLSGDGGYDKRLCYDTLRERQKEQGVPLKVAIPPRRGARIWQHGNSQQERLARDENLRRIRQVGRKRWKEESGYHRRSLAETAMFRLKTIFGDKSSARVFEAQAAEAFIRCAALNQMTGLGMPESYAV
jgi:Transposase DDE domain